MPYNAAAFWMTVLLPFFAGRSAAQPVYYFENITEANGLSDNRVTCFLKDATGFMWIGTENGLNRFDGHSFLVYKPGKKAASISDIFINDIEQDSRGNLWVATPRGLNMIDTKKDTTLVFIPDKPEGIPSDLIWDVYIDRHDRVWIAPDIRDLCYYDINKKTFTSIPWLSFVSAQFPNNNDSYNSIRKIYYKSEDELWLGTALGLFSYRISTKQFTWHKSFVADHFIQLETAADGKTVFFTQNPIPSLETLHIETGSKNDVPWKEIPVNAPVYQRDKNYNNYRWLPAGKNIIEINTITGEMLSIGHRADDPYSLPDGTIRSIYRDNTGLVWVATSNGIGKFNPAMNSFPFTKVLPAVKTKGTDDIDLFRFNHPVHTVFYSKQDDKYYISSPATNSLLIKDRTTGKTETITSIHGIPLKRCSVIFEDSKGMLWILAAKNAFCYDRVSRMFSVSAFKAEDKIILFTDMAEDQDGNLWIAAYNDGLYRFNPKNGDSRKYDEHNGGSKLPTCLYFDAAENLMLSGSFGKGVFAFDKNGEAQRFMKNLRNFDHTGYSLITDITEDNQGILWISFYANGIARVENYADSATISARFISTKDGLPENNIYSLQSDRKGNIWTAAWQGITRLNAAGNIIENYNRKTGLNFTDFYSPLSITASGEILTGIEDGFIRFHPDSLPSSSADFKVVFTAVRSKNGLETNNLSWSDNDIQFDFAALSFIKPAQTKYEYLLEGLNKNWVNAHNAASTRYNNLAPGSYTFKARAIDFTGRYSSNIASFSFTVAPPWWQTWWFRVGLALFIIGALYFLFRLRIRSIQNKARVRQQMTELKARALRAQMNPHFIFNCLNAIQELIVRENYDASYKYLSKFSRLLRMVLDHSEKNFIPLSTEIEMCQLYLDLESMRFKHSFEYIVKVDPAIDTDTVMIPSLLMQPFIENAIWHGLLQKNGDKKLIIEFIEQAGMVTCTIQDNGIGRKRSAEINAKKIGSKHFNSKGIEITKQRIEHLQGIGSQHTTIEIIDSEDENGAATGTLVQIVFSTTENRQS